MPRFFIPPEQIQSKRFVLSGSEAHHASRVLRMKAGDAIDLFDGKNSSYQGKITLADPDRIEGDILSSHIALSTSPTSVVLYQALIKAVKWDWLVEKACEVGVAKLVPIVTARTIVKPTNDRAIDRWKRIALAASKQCGRSDFMEVVPAQPLSEAIQEHVPESLSLIPWEKEGTMSIRRACQGFQGKTIRIFIGPEGGWDSAEVDSAKRQGVVSVRLGATLLRSETAGIVAATLAMSECGGPYA